MSDDFPDEGDPSSDEGNEQPYSRDDLVALASELDTLGATATDPWDLLRRLTAAHIKPGEDVERNALLVGCERALSYSFTDDERRYGALNIGVRFSSSLGDWPPGFEVIGKPEKLSWSELADKVTHPLPKAHFTDLALAAGVKGGRPIADAAANLYLQLSHESHLDPYYRASCVRRSWTLARQFALGSESDVRKWLYAEALRLAPLSDVPPGVLFRPIEPLAIAPRNGPFVEPTREQVSELLTAIEEQHGNSVVVFEAIHEVREQVATTEREREDARRVLVQGYLDLADSAEGLLRLSWLQSAAAEAQKYGLTNLRGIAVTAMQRSSVDDLGLQAHSFEFHMPRHAIDERLSRYRWSRGVLDALEIWFTSPAPTGSYSANLKQASEVSGRGILQLVTRTTLSPDGLPLRSSAGPETAADEWLERLEGLYASTYGIVLANELTAINTEYGRKTGSEIATRLATTFGCDYELAKALGEAIANYWDERFTDSARAAFPLVEAGARGLLLTLGEPLFRIETGNAEGHFPALETYADRLEARGLDVDWVRTIRGPVATLRNAMAHGHKLTATSTDAALLLRTAAMLVSLTPSTSTETDRMEIPLRLRDPLQFVASSLGLRKAWRRVWAATRRSRQN